MSLAPRFCWECSRKLWGRHYALLLVDGHVRKLHKECARLIEAGLREEASDER